METAAPPAGENPVYATSSPSPSRVSGKALSSESSSEFVILSAPMVQLESAILGLVPRRRPERLNRAVNITIATLALILLLPALVIIAVAIRLTSPGLIIYQQERTGLDRRWRNAGAVDERRKQDLGGRLFTIFKFRTMAADAERESGAVLASERDPRMTSVGRHMRRLRLDELPQFWNVVRGDMNVVGPRPERPTIVARLREDIVEYQWRHRVKPGITGLAQVNQDYASSIADVRSKLSWDVEYIERQGVALDLLIMLVTIPAVLGKFRGR